jgi:SAM-dependent methyltransferase
MSGYNRDAKTFTLTAVKMEHYHRHHTHATFSRKICPICNSQYGQEYMEMVATFLTANGLEVVDVGDAHITINAPSKPRKKFGMWVTKESDALYQLLAGRIEPRPGSLPQGNSFLETDDIESSHDEVPPSFQEINALTKYDEIAETNKRHWERMVQEGCGFTQPWLDLDRDIIRQYVNEHLDPLPEPLDVMYPTSVLTDVEGKDVLCLGAGGGQQSVVFALLGSRVTVVDLSEGQLKGDQEAATHYGYDIRTIQADMRDLSKLENDVFDLVYGTGMCYIPDVREVYAEVARVLKPGGIYRTDIGNPATEFVDMDDWDGNGYRITMPYAERRRQRPDGAVEFRHFLSDLFNGLITNGLSIQRVQESPHFHQQGQPRPGSWKHWLTYVTMFAIVAKKESA